jgi:hypothetical protein
MRVRKKAAVLGNARILNKQFLNDLGMVVHKNNYRAPGMYHMTAEKFAEEAGRVEESCKHDAMIAFICQAFVEQSRGLSKKVNRIIRWIEKVTKEAEAKAKEKAVKDSAAAAVIPQGKTKFIDFTAPDTLPATPSQINPEGMNRKQRRFLERKGIPISPLAAATSSPRPETGPEPSPSDGTEPPPDRHA